MYNCQLAYSMVSVSIEYNKRDLMFGKFKKILSYELFIWSKITGYVMNLFLLWQTNYIIYTNICIVKRYHNR
jgi:hypothetical protein